MLWIGFLLIPITILLHIGSVSANVVLELNGCPWKLYGPKNISDIPATVPGCVYTDLQRGGVIKDPLFRMNDDEYSWIGKSNWTYVGTFQVSRTFLELRKIDLVSEGLDTIAQIKINGVVIGSTTNMFRRYVFNIKNILKEGENFIEIFFTNPWLYIEQQKESYPYGVPPEPHFNFIRKTASSFGWDWGPSFPSMGIWKDIYVVGYATTSLRYVSVQTFPDEDEWVLQLTTHFDLADVINGNIITLIFKINELNILRKDILYLKTPNSSHDTRIHLRAKDLELWWPNGMGKAKLYEVEVVLYDDFGYMDGENLTVGFRKVDLVQDEISNGLTFYFQINGIPVFMKGSNWIPASSFQGSVNDSQVEWLLRSTADANMNILRVWGGGVYESKKFYELADRLGIMIWQDFMFACALYPADAEFLENVRQEVIHQVRRLNRHPSIIIWAGNNENEQALENNWFQVPPDMYKTFKSDYIRLYVDTIRETVINEDMTRPYVTSSPSNGLETIVHDWLSPDPENEKFGDVHFYNYTNNGWFPNLYPIPRFASEFGFQSWPSLETLRPVSNPEEDLYIDGSFSNHRQRHVFGNSEMETLFKYHFEFQRSANKTDDFLKYVYLTQVDQAMSIKTEVEHYRRYQSEFSPDGRGLTMGTMYWQLNDVWQGPSWSSIEYGGKWKMLHYYARHFYSPRLLSPSLEGNMVKVHFIGDDLSVKNVANFSLMLQCFNVNSFKQANSWRITFQQNSVVKLIYQNDLDTLVKECNCLQASNCFFQFNVFSDSKQVSENFLFGWQTFPKIPVSIEAIVTQVDDKTFNILLKTNNFAFFVLLKLPGLLGEFSENGFMMTSETYEVTFTSNSTITNAGSFGDHLQISTLYHVFK